MVKKERKKNGKRIPVEFLERSAAVSTTQPLKPPSDSALPRAAAQKPKSLCFLWPARFLGGSQRVADVQSVGRRGEASWHGARGGCGRGREGGREEC